MEILIRNMRYNKPCEEWQVRVDRTSVLGNPFYMESEAKRVEVCEKYDTYFKEKVKAKDVAFMNELRRLYKIAKRFGKLELYCWCFPKRCHAETIKKFLLKYLEV